MTTTTPPPAWIGIKTITDAIAAGVYDDGLAEIMKAVQVRITSVRKSRTIDDYTLGATVVFNDYCGTKYLRGHRATVVRRGRTKIAVVLDKPVGRFIRIENGAVKSAEINVPPSIVDIVGG